MKNIMEEHAFLYLFRHMKKCEKDFPSFNYNNPAAVSFINLQAKFISFSYLISDKLSLFLS